MLCQRTNWWRRWRLECDPHNHILSSSAANRQHFVHQIAAMTHATTRTMVVRIFRTRLVKLQLAALGVGEEAEIDGQMAVIAMSAK